jgi:hypothetical protein
MPRQVSGHHHAARVVRVELPERQREALERIIDAADDAALHGDVARGYGYLRRGLHHAEEAMRDGVWWAEPLVAAYCEALEDYEMNYGTGEE